MIKEIALTFDDGPNPPYTDQILDFLKEYSLPATFFVCGANIKRHPDTLKRIVQEGHLIGNHSYYHQYVGTLLGTNFLEILKTQQLIEEARGQKEKIFRAPFGVNQFWLNWLLKRQGFKIAPLGIMGGDWRKNSTPEFIVETVLTSIKQGIQDTRRVDPIERVQVTMLGKERLKKLLPSTIILLHDGVSPHGNRSKTVEAVPSIVETLLDEGYKFIDLREWMKKNSY